LACLCRSEFSPHESPDVPIRHPSRPGRTNSCLPSTLRPLGLLEHTSASAQSHLSVKRQTTTIGYAAISVNEESRSQRSAEDGAGMVLNALFALPPTFYLVRRGRGSDRHGFAVFALPNDRVALSSLLRTSAHYSACRASRPAQSTAACTPRPEQYPGTTYPRES
jgi:hypothetical protein